MWRGATRLSCQPEVIRFEPAAALFADEDGMAVLRALCETAGTRLAPDGFLIVEFGAGQHSALRVIAQAARLEHRDRARPCGTFPESR